MTFPPPLQDVPLKTDHTHPNWHDSPCLLYEDNDLLVEGVTQAKILINTIQLQEECPPRIENLLNHCPENVHDLVLRY